MNKKINIAIILSIIAFIGSFLNASTAMRATYPKAFIPFGRNLEVDMK